MSQNLDSKNPMHLDVFASRFGPEQVTAPYADALTAHYLRDTLSLMVPGHGANDEGIASELNAFLGERAVGLDIPPLVEGIDVGPDSPLIRAQELAARAWGARRAWFLTNGASQANRMAMYAVKAFGLGDCIVAQRSAHSSFTDGLILADLNPEFVVPSIDLINGIHHGLTPKSVNERLERAIGEGKSVAAVYVISPSYFGAVVDVLGITRVAHKHGVPVVVDCAWGSHFGFHPGLPESPARLGADLIVSSTHKLAGSLTQSAMLQLGDGPFADALEPLVERAFMITQSTSASALLLGSLDVARRALVQNTDAISSSIAVAKALEQRIRRMTEYSVIGDDFANFDDIVERDPLRIAIDVSKLGITGHELRSRLGEGYGTFLEISTASAVVAIVGAGKTPDIARFTNALTEIAADVRNNYGGSSQLLGQLPSLPEPGRLILRPRQAYFAQTEVLPVAEAVGRVSSDALAAYPPGIPNVLPGEEITHETVEFLQAVSASPIGYVRGALNKEVSSFRVVKV